MADDYTTLRSDGAWCWFHDPRAVKSVGGLVIDRVLVSTRDRRSITPFSDLFVHILEIFTNQKLNSSVGATDECHD